MTIHAACTKTTVIGIDFSGAEDAGKFIWIAIGESHSIGLHIGACAPASDILQCGAERGTVFAALRRWLEKQHNAVIGLDFPFGLPARLLAKQGWKEFVLGFTTRFSTAESFKKGCWGAAGNQELKRETDNDDQTPLSPYNLRLYKQTYYGIRDVLAPLVEERRICVLPMGERIDGVPQVIEICPASTLKRLKISSDGYKGRECIEQREAILNSLLAKTPACLAPDLQKRVLANSGGDALDALIACIAVHAALRGGQLAVPANPIQAIEGRVFA